MLHVAVMSAVYITVHSRSGIAVAYCAAQAAKHKLGIEVLSTEVAATPQHAVDEVGCLPMVTVVGNMHEPGHKYRSRTPSRKGHQPYIEHFLLILGLQCVLVSRFILYTQKALPGPALLDVGIVPGPSLRLKNMHIATYGLTPQLEYSLQAMLHATGVRRLLPTGTTCSLPAAQQCVNWVPHLAHWTRVMHCYALGLWKKTHATQQLACKHVRDHNNLLVSM